MEYRTGSERLFSLGGRYDELLSEFARMLRRQALQWESRSACGARTAGQLVSTSEKTIQGSPCAKEMLGQAFAYVQELRKQGNGWSLN